ncbi:MAG TPA: hypothetical protein VLL08_15785 [Kineosporiaceae bacterium]|nr:hypothetical protein [Kineosporiaceae bacterium]
MASVLLLAISACEDDPTPDASATTTQPTTSASTSAPASAPASVGATKPSPSKAANYAANTKKVCAKVDNLFEGAELERFAKDLGRHILYKKAKKAAKADQARDLAKKELKALATAVRSNTSSAQDPELKAAGEKSAVSIEKTAADNAFFAKLKTIKDVNGNLTSEMTPWLTPLSVYCA